MSEFVLVVCMCAAGEAIGKGLTFIFYLAIHSSIFFFVCTMSLHIDLDLSLFFDLGFTHPKSRFVNITIFCGAVWLSANINIKHCAFINDMLKIVANNMKVILS